MVPVPDSAEVAADPARTLAKRAPLAEKAVSPVLAATDSVPLFIPMLMGAKSTLALQSAPAASVVPQVVPRISKPADAVTAPMLTGTVPGLKTMNSFGVLWVPSNVGPKSNSAGVMVTGGGATPAPAIEMVREKGDTLSHTAIVPVNDPIAVGWNVAVNWHGAPGA